MAERGLYVRLVQRAPIPLDVNLRCYPDEMLVAGDVVMLTGCDGLGGDVYGWDLKRGAEAWQIDLRRFVRRARRHA